MTLEQIGQKLKSARDGSGLSLSQIQEKTKIPFSHLSAIDAGNFDDLPEPVYVAGFIRRYADCVGLDSQSLVDEYRIELESLVPQPAKSGFIFKSNKNNGNNQAPAAYYNRQTIERSAPNLFKVIPFYALWIVLISGLIVYLINRQGAIDLAQQDSALITLRQSTTALNPGKIGGSPQSNTAESTEQSDNLSAEQSNASDNSSEHIYLRAKNHVWVEVKAISNGESLFNGFLESGDSRDFVDAEGLRIRAGNGGNVLITASGKTAELGAAGKIAEKTFTNKVNQITQNQSETTSNDHAIEKRNSSIAQSNLKKKPDDLVAAKKPVDSTTITEKKPAIASTPKPHAKEDLPIHAKNTVVSPETNKNIDVPYRYSE